jgi:hypothetical protein
MLVPIYVVLPKFCLGKVAHLLNLYRRSKKSDGYNTKCTMTL